uniref:Delta-aminolevulinic acid dehydratase n=1 Tax=Rhodotorula toruloides TaxID=5286 RepID=A0A0K3CBJ4_RHOTO
MSDSLAVPIQSTLAGGYFHPLLRSLQAERHLTKDMLMYPIFITDEPDAVVEIKSLPGQKRWGINKLHAFLAPLVAKGLRSVILFGVPLHMQKDSRGSPADDPNTPVILATQLIRREFPGVVVACDVCLCEYTDHGHCGELCDVSTLTEAEQVAQAKVIDNGKSVKRMQEVALAYARAGAQIVAPSDMMDGRIGAIKQALVDNGFGNRCSVMSYSAKFASGMYGPFREAAGSVPNFGDRKCYQLPPNARGLARRAIFRDVAEGADFLMVKPAMPYLDIMREARELAPNHPLACYQVSGEFAMLHAGAEAGVYELKTMAFESVEGFLRAGCTLVLTYFTPDFLDWLDEDKHLPSTPRHPSARFFRTKPSAELSNEFLPCATHALLSLFSTESNAATRSSPSSGNSVGCAPRTISNPPRSLSLSLLSPNYTVLQCAALAMPALFRTASPSPRSPPPSSTRDSLDSQADTAETPLLPRWNTAKHSKDWEDSADEGRERSFLRPAGNGRTRADGRPYSHALDLPSSPRSYNATLRSHRRQARLVGLLYSSAWVCFAGTCLIGAGVLGWVGHFLWMRHAAYATAVFEKPMLPKPVEVEGRVEAFSADLRRNGTEREEESVGPLAWRLKAIEDELQARFDGMGLPGMTSLPCAGISVNDTSLTSRYSALRRTGPSEPRQGKTLLALNLYNSEDVLPTLSHALLTVTSFLDPSTVHVSIFENGSTDKTTLALAHLAAALTALGASHTILSDPRKTNWKAVDRIAQLSVYRNVLLSPLSDSPNSFSDIVFINDVYTCPSDVVELLFQRKAQEADAACAMDWRPNGGIARKWNGSVKFYDNWVSRSLSGETLRARADILSEWRNGVEEIFDQPGEERWKERWNRGLPVPVYSCWNGMLALDATPFTSTTISPRYDPSSPLPLSSRKSWRRPPPLTVSTPARFRSALKSPGECAASECKTLAKDFWTRGFDRWLHETVPLPLPRRTESLKNSLVRPSPLPCAPDHSACFESIFALIQPFYIAHTLYRPATTSSYPPEALSRHAKLLARSLGNGSRRRWLPGAWKGLGLGASLLAVDRTKLDQLSWRELLTCLLSLQLTLRPPARLPSTRASPGFSAEQHRPFQPAVILPRRPTTTMARSSTDSAPDDSTPETPLLPRYRSDSPPADGADEKRARRGGAARVKGAWMDPEDEEDEEDGLGEYRGLRWMQGRRKVGCGVCAVSSARCILAASILALAAVLAALASLVYLRHFRTVYRVYEDPLVPDPREVEGMVGRFPRSLARSASEMEEPVGPLAWRLQAIEDELQARFDGMGLPGMTSLPCAGISVNDTSLTSRYSALRQTGPSEPRQGKTLLALNLYNSEDVLPTLSHALLTVTSFLDPSTVHVSIFENGSTDNTTLALAHLAAALTALGASHTILSDPRKTNWKAVDRIAQLAVYRNVVLAPLERDEDFDDIVFINDVFVCPSDILELIFQRKAQEADAACATDWIANKGWASRLNPDVRFYDSWVSRSLSGETLRRQEDFLATLRKGVNVLFDQPGEERYKARWDKGLPVPVYSCWNGLLALDAQPFTSTSISPRYDLSSSLPSSSRKSWPRDSPIASTEPARFRSALNNPGECAASECKLIAKDFWSRGFDRWLVRHFLPSSFERSFDRETLEQIVPSVRVTYSEPVYSNPSLLSLSSLHPPSPSPTLDAEERIDWPSYTPPEEVVCWAWTPGPHVDFEWARAVWERPYETFAKVLSRG